MRRWCSVKEFVTADQDRLQNIIVHSPREDKIAVKHENKGYNYTRLLLVPEKEHNYPQYKIAKMSRV